MHAEIVGELGVERHGEDVRLTHRHRVAVDARQHLHALAVRLYPGGADEHRSQGSDPLHLQVGLEGVRAGARRRCARRSRRARRGGRGPAGSSPRRCRARACRSRRTRPAARPAPRAPRRASWSWTRRPGITRPSSPSSSSRVAHRPRLGPELARAPSCAPRSRPAGRGRRRPASSPAAVLEQAAAAGRVERPDLEPGHRLAEVARRGGHALRVLEVGGGLHDRPRPALRIGRT